MEKTALAVKITAHLDPFRPNACRFEVDRPVHAGGSAYFGDAAAAKGSPLAEKLFAVEGISSVRISGSTVVATKEGFEEWRPAAVKIGAAIREQLQSGEPAVSAEFTAKRLSDEELGKGVRELLEVQINPAVASHGGVIELLEVKEGNVYLRMGGGCQGCASSTATLKAGVESSIRERFPQVGEVFDTTDHAAGKNPYYAPSGGGGHAH